MRFTIGKSHHFSTTGGQTVPPRGQAVVELSGKGMVVDAGTGANFNQAGTLAPGSYTLTIRFEATTLISAQTRSPAATGSSTCHWT